MNFAKKLSKAHVVIGVSVLVFLWLCFGTLFSRHVKEEPGRIGVSYRTQQSTAQNRDRVLKVSGVVQSKKIVKLVCEASGKVTKVVAKGGDFLEKGDLILIIDPKNKQEIYDRALAKLQQSMVKMQAAEELQKEKLISKSDFIEAKAQYSSARADLKQAELELSNVKIVAPFSGYINDIAVNEADHLSASGANNIIGTFVAAEPTVIVSEIADNKIRLVRNGQKALIESVTGDKYQGNVVSISRVINQDSGSFPIEIAVDNRDFSLLHGQVVAVQIFLKEYQAHKVPKSALVLDSSGNIGIKAIDAQGSSRFYQAEVVDEDLDSVWVAGPPETLDVVVLGQANVESEKKS